MDEPVHVSSDASANVFFAAAYLAAKQLCTAEKYNYKKKKTRW